MLGSSFLSRVQRRFGQTASRLIPIFVLVGVITLASALLVYWMGLGVNSAVRAVTRNQEIIAGLEDLLPL